MLMYKKWVYECNCWNWCHLVNINLSQSWCESLGGFGSKRCMHEKRTQCGMNALPKHQELSGEKRQESKLTQTKYIIIETAGEKMIWCTARASFVCDRCQKNTQFGFRDHPGHHGAVLEIKKPLNLNHLWDAANLLQLYVLSTVYPPSADTIIHIHRKNIFIYKHIYYIYTQIFGTSYHSKVSPRQWAFWS